MGVILPHGPPTPSTADFISCVRAFSMFLLLLLLVDNVSDSTLFKTDERKRGRKKQEGMKGGGGEGGRRLKYGLAQESELLSWVKSLSLVVRQLVTQETTLSPQQPVRVADALHSVRDWLPSILGVWGWALLGPEDGG